MNIHNLRGKNLEYKEKDSRLARWWKDMQIKYNPCVYSFDSLLEFENHSLNGDIKRQSWIVTSHIKVDSVLSHKYGIDLKLRDGEKELSFERLKPGHYEDWGLKDKCWLELNKLKDGDELRMLTFIYHHHSIYQLVYLERKDIGGNDDRRFEATPKNNCGQSIDELIAEAYRK
ncbi:hypothetical protein HYV89_03655 [Candidatus Woesearchaeota archaeon]|nr:hypothetical protein [Candidatus Woesearchaeota archaeon]